MKNQHLSFTEPRSASAPEYSYFSCVQAGNLVFEYLMDIPSPPPNHHRFERYTNVPFRPVRHGNMSIEKVESSIDSLVC